MAPRWLARLLHVVLPPDRHDDLIGDLEELHDRRLARWGAARAMVVTVAEGLGLVALHLLARPWRTLSSGDGPLSSLDLRLALRLAWRQPVVTLTAVVALGVGIGLAAGGFSVFRQTLYGTLPFENGDRWTVLDTDDAVTSAPRPLDLEHARAFRTSASSIAYLAAVEAVDLNVVHESGEVERIPGARVTPGIFAHLPYVPLVGRLFNPRDGAAGSEPVALIRESLWERRLSRAPDVLTRRLDVAGVSHRVVGVLPDAAAFPSEGEIWLPIDEETLGATHDRAPVAGNRQIAILADGVGIEEAEDQLTSLSAGIADAGSGLAAVRPHLTPMARMLSSPEIQVGAAFVSVLLLALLLVIAANVANLVMARTSRRAPEIAVRTALGASRTRLVGQLLLEALVLGALASAPGLALAAGVLALYDRVLDELPFWIQLRLDPGAAVAVVALAVLASAAVGAMPALRATRRAPGDALRAAGRGSTLGIGRVGGAMIALEVGLSVALLGSALVFARGYEAYVDPAFDLPDDRVLTTRVAMDVGEDDLRPGGAATVGDSILRTARNLTMALAELPGVTAVGVASRLPRTSPDREPVALEGRQDLIPTPVVYQDEGLFEALEVRPIAGRTIATRDMEPGAPAVAVVNRSFAERHYGTTQVIGRRLRVGMESGDGIDPPWREIVGVVPDVMEVTGSGAAAGIYLPFEAVSFFSVALAVGGDPSSHEGRLRRAVFDLDPNLNLSEIVRLEDVGAENRNAFAVMSSAFSGIGLITLLLSLAGVYSIVSLAVSQRTREIGVRVALGAANGSVLWAVLRRPALLVWGGALVGAALGWRLARVQLFVFVVPEPRPWLFPGLVALMGVVGLAACWVPARRALSIDPVEALRSED